MRYKPDWLALVVEPAIDPDLSIIDAHHHLYDDPVRNANYGRVMLDEYLAEIFQSGHNVTNTVYVEAHNSFLDDGPEEFRTVGETRVANTVGEQAASKGAATPKLCSGIVSSINLLLGSELDAVVDAHFKVAPERLKGVRMLTARDLDVQMPHQVPEGLLREPALVEGVRRIAKRGLSFDAYVFHPQIGDVEYVARQVPEATIILDHIGAPLAIGRFKDKREEVFRDWHASIASIAKLPNVHAKLGGMVADWCGGDFEDRPLPPTSEAVAAAAERYYRATIDLFGPDRCMFISNFPRDRVTVSYGVLWNSYKRIAAGYSARERAAMFHDTAARVYRIA